MQNLVALVFFGVSVHCGQSLQAASLDLPTMGPVSIGEGGVFYDGFSAELVDDFSGNPIVLTTGPLAGSEVSFAFSGGSFDFFSIGSNFYNVLNHGYTETGISDTLEFQLTPGSFSMGSRDELLFNIRSVDFSFSPNGPTSFFDASLDFFNEYATNVTVSVQSLASLTPVPVPASLPLLLVSMCCLSSLRSKSRKFEPFRK